ncbi:MJ1255/VC2487 family glycosyltransferase [Vibrio zhugei]|uniref:MJ1255/VC2487 family glycosyltransferase n=1 Tax=Vibrio zhugei TaxID=2479546 RepID=A0ABV7C576_9VIBR|nr:MJ1255/VC2487 family glycosyltransferase [Vibrio zhugei]
MKILYGVQGTGNGHIARARAMNQALRRHEQVDVDFLFTGRDADKYFSMEEFGEYQTRQGLTFATQNGKIDYGKTAINNNLLRVYQDMQALDLSSYDLVLNDFEPISAWAAKKQNIPSISISHQNAFRYNVPLKGASWMDKMIMQNFAPADHHISLHWYHFDQPILPPIIHTSSLPPCVDNFILIYLPFELLTEVINLVERFSHEHFICYHPDVTEVSTFRNLQLRPLCRDGFQEHLRSCAGVMANGGFELASEALSLGKKMLLKPLSGQFEQQSNVATLEHLGLASSMDYLDPSAVRQWLDEAPGERVIYPNVAFAISDWIVAGDWAHQDGLFHSLWQQVNFPHRTDLHGDFVLS